MSKRGSYLGGSTIIYGRLTWPRQKDPDLKNYSEPKTASKIKKIRSKIKSQEELEHRSTKKANRCRISMEKRLNDPKVIARIAKREKNIEDKMGKIEVVRKRFPVADKPTKQK